MAGITGKWLRYPEHASGTVNVSRVDVCREWLKGSSRSLLLVLRKVPQLVLQRFDLSFRITSADVLAPNKNYDSLVLLRTLHIMLRLDAFQFEPAPVQDLVCEDGNEDGLEDRPAAVFVEIALLGISGCIRE